MSSIPVRKISVKPSAATPRYWLAGQAFETHFFNALSTTFPDGERFFIAAVRRYSQQIGDPELRAQVTAFSGQEGQHSREHDEHVKLLLDQGFTGITPLNNTLRTVTRWLLKHTPRYALAVTAAIEHITATLAHVLLSDPQRYLDVMHDDMRFFWNWHAIEELEHKAVAFDVYQATGGDYPMRCLAMLHIMLSFPVDIFVRHCYMLWRDDKLLDAAEWRRGLGFLYGKHGVLTGLWRGMGVYFRKNFHPDQLPNGAAVAEFSQRYANNYA